VPIDIRADHFQIVCEILKRRLDDHQVWVFGSRAQGTAKKTSDLDLCIKGNSTVSLKLLADLRDDFSESNLPYKVDVVAWYSISEGFKKIVGRDKVLISYA